jgi:hypothetical protein
LVKEITKKILKLVLGERAIRHAIRHLRYAQGYAKFKIKSTKAGLDSKKTYDIIFYCQHPSHWQNISKTVEILNESDSLLSLLVVTDYNSHDYSEAIYPEGVSVFDGLPRALSYLYAKLIYSPQSGFRRSILNNKDCITVHAIHSLVGIEGVYQEDAFDDYDYIMCAGPHHVSDFRALSEKRSVLKGKFLVPAGYPKLDLALSWAGNRRLKESRITAPTIIYAPTYVYPVNEGLASLRSHGAQIVQSLVDAGYNVIFRPHPVSMKGVDRNLVLEITKTYQNQKFFKLDTAKDYKKSFEQADLMVTDLSGTGFTFSLSFKKPTIFVCFQPAAELGLKGIQFDDRNKIGGVARTLEEMIDLIIKLFAADSIPQQIADYREKNFFNVGKSDIYIAEALLSILNQHEKIEWIRLS